MRLFIFIFFTINIIYSQNLHLNNKFLEDQVRQLSLLDSLDVESSFTIRPLNYSVFNTESKYSGVYEGLNIFNSKNEKFKLKVFPIEYHMDFNSHHPYNRNNGSMIPNRGYQHILSSGFFFKAGPLEIQIIPEHVFAENKDFDKFWDGHYPEIWIKRYKLWNNVDIPERFGDNEHNNLLLGQSRISLNWKNLSLGMSNENLWWGPSFRNSIMMSNQARGFKHITINTNRPIKTPLGKIEFQLVSGRLESSGFKPTNYDVKYSGNFLYVPKINQNGEEDDWRYFQGLVISFSPKIIDGLTLGFIRWAQMYSALVENRYWWMEGNPTYFPVFENLFRNKDKFSDFEAQSNQAAGIFFRWFWKDSKAEIYGEFHHNDSKQNIRDLLLDSDHSRAATLGIQKVFFINNSPFSFKWEWTQMEQSASRLVREAGSWYEHRWVYDGYTNYGEVLGSGIGPGSNSHFFSLSNFNRNKNIQIGFEVVEHDNDFYHEAFASALDPRRYWKDFNLHLSYTKKIKDFWININSVFIKSLNYQWELDDKATPYFHPGNDVNNLHISLKLIYAGF